MQLKEEFRTYEALRREHDSQIVQIAMEGGLRIAPDQWSSLLYGDQSHKSHMQSIIDKVFTWHGCYTVIAMLQTSNSNLFLPSFSPICLDCMKCFHYLTKDDQGKKLSKICQEM